MVTQKIELSDLDGYDWDWWAKYGDEVVAELAEAFKTSILAAEADIPVLTAQRLATEYAEQRGAELLRLDGTDNLVKTTRRRVGKLVADSIENGDSLKTLQKKLRLNFAYSVERADMIAQTETAIAHGQGAKGAAMQQGRNEKRWMLNTDVDPICVGNAAQGWIKLVDTFASGVDTIPQHPRCLIGSSLVSAQGVSAASKRWYEGEIVVIRTARGNQLTCTPNHPILTPTGWIKAELLKEGVYVMSSAVGQRVSVGDVHNDLMVAPIEQITDSFAHSSKVSATPVPITSEDFHGDVPNDEIAIIYSNIELGPDKETAFLEQMMHTLLVPRVEDISSIARVGLTEVIERSLDKPTLRHNDARGRNMRGLDLVKPLIVGHAFPAIGLALASSTQSNTSLTQASPDDLAGYPVPTSEQLDRLAGVVFDDQLIEVRREPFSGHVYNLETQDGFYMADSIVTHNCQCNVIYRTVDREEEFMGLKAKYLPVPHLTQELIDDRKPFSKAATAYIEKVVNGTFTGDYKSDLVTEVHCPKCSKRLPMNNVPKGTEAYCKRCDETFEV